MGFTMVDDIFKKMREDLRKNPSMYHTESAVDYGNLTKEEVEMAHKTGNMDFIAKQLLDGVNNETQVSTANKPKFNHVIPKDISKLVSDNINNIPVMEGKIRTLGSDIITSVNGASDQISERFRVAQSGDFKDILHDMKETAETLRVSDQKPQNFFERIKGFFVDAKQQLQDNFESASEAFSQIIVRVDQHIKNQEQWIVDLDQMRAENYQFYRQLDSVVKELKSDLSYFEKVQEQLKSCPSDAPDIHTAVNQVSEVNDLCRRTRVRINDFTGILAVCDQNMTIINSKKSACNDSITALEGIKIAIPEIKKQFAIYMASQQNAEATALANGLREETNDTFKSASDFNKNSTIAAREASGKTVIKTDTLAYMQKNIMDTIDKIQALDKQQEQDYINTQQTIENQRQEFFNKILEKENN